MNVARRKSTAAVQSPRMSASACRTISPSDRANGAVRGNVASRQPANDSRSMRLDLPEPEPAFVPRPGVATPPADPSQPVFPADDPLTRSRGRRLPRLASHTQPTLCGFPSHTGCSPHTSRPRGDWHRSERGAPHIDAGAASSIAPRSPTGGTVPRRPSRSRNPTPLGRHASALGQPRLPSRPTRGPGTGRDGPHARSQPIPPSSSRPPRRSLFRARASPGASLDPPVGLPRGRTRASPPTPPPREPWTGVVRARRSREVMATVEAGLPDGMV